MVDLGGHIADLLDVATELRSAGTTSLAAVGHSLGGDVVVGAALAEPRAFDAIGRLSSHPMPWLGFRRTAPGSDRPREWAPLAEDPGDEAERFFGRMVSPEAWRRLTDEGRASRRADGPALVADMTFMRGRQPFDVLALTTPAVFGHGGRGVARRITAPPWPGSAPTCPGPRPTRSPGPSTAPICRTRTISPPSSARVVGVGRNLGAGS